MDLLAHLEEPKYPENVDASEIRNERVDMWGRMYVKYEERSKRCVTSINLDDSTEYYENYPHTEKELVENPCTKTFRKFLKNHGDLIDELTTVAGEPAEDEEELLLSGSESEDDCEDFIGMIYDGDSRQMNKVTVGGLQHSRDYNKSNPADESKNTANKIQPANFSESVSDDVDEENDLIYSAVKNGFGTPPRFGTPRRNGHASTPVSTPSPARRIECNAMSSKRMLSLWSPSNNELDSSDEDAESRPGTETCKLKLKTCQVYLPNINNVNLQNIECNAMSSKRRLSVTSGQDAEDSLNTTPEPGRKKKKKDLAQQMQVASQQYEDSEIGEEKVDDPLWSPSNDELEKKMYRCKECSFKSKHRASLYRHIQSEHEGLKYYCNECDYESKYKIGLTNHIQAKHEGVTYSCNKCEYDTKYKQNLKEHIRVEHKGITYSCKQCDYNTKNQRHLTSHIQAEHEGVTYQCKKCSFKTKYKSHVKSHNQAEHDGITYSCMKCDYKTGYKGNLKPHMKSMHSNDPHQNEDGQNEPEN